MELKDKLITSFTAFDKELNTEHNVLKPIRSQALKTFTEKGFPSKKLEAWKYTSLNAILKQEFSFENQVNGDILELVKPYILQETDSYKLIFINGVFCEELSQKYFEPGITVCSLSQALNEPEYKQDIEQYYNQVADKQDSLTALNTSFAQQGAFISLAKSKVLSKPVQILYFTTSADKAIFVQPRNLVIARQNAQVRVYERHQNIGQANSFTNVVTEIFAEKTAQVDYYKLQDDVLESSLIDNTFIDQQDNTFVSVHTFSFGGKVTRNNLNFYQNGEHIDSTLKGITLIGGKQHVDHYTLVSHNQPNCESHQNYKGIYDGNSVGVFNGKIYVDKIAQKTDGFQQSNNILLTDKATIYAKPQLEIFADDVKCSHGCTIGQLDMEALFYMRQRGIGKQEAKALLMYAFTDEVLESIKIPELKKKVSSIIGGKLGVSMDLDL
ncbi:Fe-S cluster assembly protein SufD [Myroides sp. LJL110]